MNDDEKIYEIGGVNYTQKTLVLGQIKQLVALCKDERIYRKDLSIQQIIELLGDKLPMALAVVMIPDGCGDLSKKDNSEIARALEWNLTIDATVKVLADFLSCNPREQIEKAVEMLKVQIEAMKSSKHLLKTSSASSAEETTQSVSESSGAPPLETQEGTSNGTEEKPSSDSSPGNSSSEP